MSDQQKREDPQFKVESRDDLAELLDRAGNWAERDVGADVIAAEFRQARDFVEDEIQDEPELVTDGGVDQGESAIPQKEWIETLLESLGMVQWDRFVQAEDGGLGVYFDIYGWIDREEDAYKDFILLRVFPETEENLRMFTTSSDRYHDEINEILFGETAETNHCERVEHTFEVPNVVENDEPELVTDGGEVEAGVEHSEPCANCGDPVATTPGMDSCVRVVYRDTTEYGEEYYCNEICLSEGVA